jgi:hypothetical protein
MNQNQAAEYIAAMAKQLALIARSADFETTCYLLSMVVLDMSERTHGALEVAAMLDAPQPPELLS